MGIIVPLVLIGGGIVVVFYIRPKTKNSVMEIKYMQTKQIVELQNMFKQMQDSGLGNEYREFVELKGQIVADNLVETPFSNRKVAYCESTLYQVTESKEEYRDSNGRYSTRVREEQNIISNEKSSQHIYLKDSSSNEIVALEINATGCNLDIPKTFDRFEPKSNLSRYRYFNSFTWNRYGAETLGFKMTEKTINENQNLYVIGEAFKVGNMLHIGKPQDNKKPFIVTTKSEEDLVNTSDKNAMLYLAGGIIAIIAGFIMMFKLF